MAIEFIKIIIATIYFNFSIICYNSCGSTNWSGCLWDRVGRACSIPGLRRLSYFWSSSVLELSGQWCHCQDNYNHIYHTWGRYTHIHTLTVQLVQVHKLNSYGPYIWHGVYTCILLWTICCCGNISVGLFACVVGWMDVINILFPMLCYSFVLQNNLFPCW